MSPARTSPPTARQALTPPPPSPPPAIEPGWEIGPPDFVGIGSMRSGTTWWWSVLMGHPGIASPGQDQPGRSSPDANKEFHFFDHYGRVEVIDPAAYYRYFPRPGGLLAGEWTPRYMYDFWTPAMLSQVAPGARLLVMLRDPLARFCSGVARFARWELDSADPVLYHDQFGRGLYWQQLANVLGYFPREQLLVLQYERCLREFTAQAHRTLAFLGLDPGQWRPPADPGAPVGIVTGAPPVAGPETRAALHHAYRADLEQLVAAFPEVDPSLWPTCTGIR
jgi:Sulfotransferase family